MPYFFRLLLLWPCLANARWYVTDTTYHEDGSIASISYYTLKLSEELTKAELFQRGLSHLAAGDTIYMRDSIQMRDSEGNRLTEDAVPRPSILPSRSRRFPDGRPQPAPVFIPTTRYNGYVGRPIRDTLHLGRVPDIRSGDLVRIHVSHPVISLDTTVVMNAAVGVDIPVAIIPDTGSHRLTVTVEQPETGQQELFSITVEGYDLARGDFAAEVPQQPNASLVKSRRNRLFLQLEGKDKLLTVVSKGVILTRYPVGRGRDEISVRRWPPGDYLVRLRDLGSEEDSFALLRLE